MLRRQNILEKSDREMNLIQLLLMNADFYLDLYWNQSADISNIE